MNRTHVLLLVLVPLAVLLALCVAGYMKLRAGLPAADEIAEFRAPASTRVFDCKGRLVHEFFQEKRRPVSLDTVPEYLKRALIAVEDRRFYSHWGIDVVRIPGLLWWMVRHPGKLKGTSTITQQLARSMFLTYRRRLDRKLKEMILAVELEKQFSKDEIFEMYLNQIWYGGSIYGVQAAAERYFGKHVSDLNLAECATLAALVANPAVYSPYHHPDRLIQRRNIFLSKLHQTGYITMEQYQTAREESLTPHPVTGGRNEAPYFIEEVRRDLVARYGPDFVYRSGSTIYTALDLDIQRAANETVEKRLQRIEEDYRLKQSRTWYDSVVEVDSGVGAPRYLQGALVAVEVKTGYVRAMVGGRDYRRSEYNRATQAKRQTGSAFKPFLYTAAIDNGFTAANVMLDSTITLSIPGQRRYRPHNYDHKFLGPVTLRRALALSRNIVAVRLIDRLGPELVARYANLMGITEKLLPVYSLALGSIEVTLLDMTAAFATLPNRGARIRPILIERIQDPRGFIIEENVPEIQPVISPTTAYIVTSMLQSVIDEGTATTIRHRGYRGPAAGKTGTTDDYTDAWFIGYTPEICCGVWVGYDRKKTIFRGATGGGVAAPIWAYFMKQIKPDTAAGRFRVPGRIVTAPICEETGQLATPQCPRVRYEIFARGTEPTVNCPLHTPQPKPQPVDSFQPIRPDSN